MRHFDLMPKVVGEFVDDHGLHEVRVALTRGVWRSAGDQTVPVQAAPAGALVHAVFQDRPNEGESCQVWSLTQLYSVDFSESRIDVQKCVFSKRTIIVCVSCCLRCPRTSAPSSAHLTVSLHLCSSGSNARGESRAREGRRVSSKSPSRVRDGDEGVARRNQRE